MQTPASRPLGTFERAEALTGRRFSFNVVVVLRTRGTLEPETLRRALDGIQRQQALLRSRLVGSGSRWRFEPAGEAEIPLRVSERGDDDGWRDLVEDELLRRFEPGAAPLIRCAYLAGPRGKASEILLTVHHAIVDGAALQHLLRGLLARCGGREPESAGEAGLPPSADERFPAGWRAPRRWPASARFLARQLTGEIAFRWRARDRQPPPAGPFNCRILTLALTEEQTRRLVRATRRRRVGVVSALDAAMLLAVVRRRYPGRGDGAPHRYLAFPDLRPYLEPPVPPEVVGSYYSILRLDARPAADDDLWRLAAATHRRLALAARRGEGFLAARWGAFSMRTLLGQRRHRMSTVALNYTGPVELPVAVPADRGGSLELEGLHAFVSNFPLGPEYTAQTRLFRGRLWWDVVYLDVDMDRGEAVAIAEEMRRLLIEGAAGAGGDPP